MRDQQPASSTVLPQSTAEECLANLTPVHQNRVRQALSGADRDRLDVAEIADLCDRVSGRITFTEYQARGRARRRLRG